MTGVTRRARAVGVLAAGTLVSGLGVHALDRAMAGPPRPPWPLPERMLDRLPERPQRSEPVASGEPSVRAPGGLRPVLIVTPTCPWCREELAMWRRLAVSGRVAAQAVPQVLVLTRNAPGRWAKSVSVPGARQRSIEASLVEEIGLRRVPTTLWLDETNTVRHVTTGRSRVDGVLGLLGERRP